eukprot:gnl/MRDRNA2_/MRDRNA2_104630_c0_seq1.p1 gnl/MRDRNA2_/MRDRNA2_104630_c0~~gnl/MRDRNA2_/MRDRNA2_104630_c0_seq1.p1  ORF type:complete len:406 (+),score=119.35 gnl/MRDRNA2_/MRDRNA2_104630_c0_seq1:77-1294(+)
MAEGAPAKAVEQNNAEALYLNEELVDMLSILDYETEFCDKELRPMSRCYFVYPAQNGSQQYKYFTQLVVWLLKKVGREANWGKYDDPNTTCTNMLIALKEFGLPVNLPPGKLKQGYGEGVCSVLHSLVSGVLKATEFQWGPPSFPEEALAEEADVDSDAEINSVDEEDLIGDGEEEDLMYTETLKDGKEDAGDDDDDGDHGMLEATVDPKEWQLEVERVAPKLKVVVPDDPKEWRTHLEQTKGYKGIIEGMFPNTKQQLQKLSNELGTVLERIRSKENFINAQFEYRAGDYREQQEELQRVSQQYNELNEVVMNLQNDQKSVTEELEVVKSEMEERSSTVTDTAPCVKIKDAFKQLRLDARQLEVRIGVVSHTLLQAKIWQKPSEKKIGLTLGGGGGPENGEEQD